MPVIEESIPAVLEERARQRPDDVAFTFVDYDVDPGGFHESVTYSELYQRAQVVAEELLRCGSPGDRAAILAPQGLDYIIAFLGALQAGFIAVPLPVPMFGVLDDRVASALRDCGASVILTTSSAMGEVVQYVRADHGQQAPALIEVDLLDLESPDIVVAGRSHPSVAYLQYTSGSTSLPRGVVLTHENLIRNFEQGVADYYRENGGVPPERLTYVSWLPFYHDMGLIVGILWPLWQQRHVVVMSPVSFLQRPARWIKLLATNPQTFTAAPNFAYELAVRRTTDDDMAGLDMGDIQVLLNGAERVNAGTMRRFYDRFSRYNLRQTAIRPSYGLAEIVVYGATSKHQEPYKTRRFDYQQLTAGKAVLCEGEGGTEVVGYHLSGAPLIKIVDPETSIECPADTIGEMWMHGPNVASAYWRNPELTESTFGARLVNPSAGAPEGPWLRTGDLGVVFEGDLYIVGRIKDMLIVDGRNHYPDDIEATISKLTGGRVAAISIATENSEQLVAIAEIKKLDGSEADLEKLRSLKRDVTSAILDAHQLRIADLVLVAPGSLPITSSGKTRRSAAAELYRQNEFERLDNSA